MSNDQSPPNADALLPHFSDCALHNEPAMASGPCNCGIAERVRIVQGIRRDVREGIVPGLYWDIAQRLLDAYIAEQDTPRAASAPGARELGYATRLAQSVWEKHYKDDAPNWKPLPDLLGVLTQLDNMFSRMVRAAQDSGQGEAVAWTCTKCGPHHGGLYCDCPCHTHPPKPAQVGEKCQQCSGTGQVEARRSDDCSEVECPTCHGSGAVVPAREGE